MNQYRNEIRRIMISVNVIDGACEMIAKKIGIKENTLSLLYALDDGKPHSQKKISEEWLIPRTTINTIVKECIEAEYILLNSEKNTKEKTICLTEKGRGYVKQILGQVYELEEQAMQSVVKTNSSDFIEALAHFAENLKCKARDFTNE